MAANWSPERDALGLPDEAKGGAAMVLLEAVKFYPLLVEGSLFAMDHSFHSMLQCCSLVTRSPRMSQMLLFQLSARAILMLSCTVAGSPWVAQRDQEPENKCSSAVRSNLMLTIFQITDSSYFFKSTVGTTVSPLLTKQ